jgi:hypothetical protein
MILKRVGGSAMRHVKTVSLSLEAGYVELLENLAREVGSRSDAVRRLLEEHREREWENLYREYYADPKNVQEQRKLTEAMLSIVRWPEEWYEKRAPRGRKKDPAR